MQHLRFLGFATIVVWALTFLVSLSMMWHRTWMEGDPPSEIATGALHAVSVVVGVALGLSLLAPGTRRTLNGAQLASFGIAGGLAAVSISLFLKT